MPAYNAERYIVDSIESILNQTFEDFEFIIVNDASTDRTLDIIKKYANKDKRIKFLSNKKNKGIAGTRNILVKKSKGKYIAWQDADDISIKDRLYRQYLYMEKHKNVGICGGYLEIFNERGVVGIRKYKTTDKELRNRIFRYSPVAQPTSIIRKKIIDRVGYYNLNMPPAEDIDMSFRIGMVSEFANLPMITLKYREHFNSATFNKLKTIEINTLKTRLKYIGKGTYSISAYDIIYNIIQYLTLWIMPAKFRIKLFNFIRNFL